MLLCLTIVDQSFLEGAVSATPLFLVTSGDVGIVRLTVECNGMLVLVRTSFDLHRRREKSYNVLT